MAFAVVGVVSEPMAAVASPRPITVVEATLACGFPSPAADYETGKVDLSEILVPHPSASFTVRLTGHSMTRAGIHDGDLAIVDRSLTAKHDDVVVAALDGELVCKRLIIRSGRIWLMPESDDPAYRPVEVTGRPGFEIWGVITSTIRFHRK